jgi:hypothetical protein
MHEAQKIRTVGIRRTHYDAKILTGLNVTLYVHFLPCFIYIYIYTYYWELNYIPLSGRTEQVG